MTTVDITLGTIQTKSNTLNGLVAYNLTQIHSEGLSRLASMMNLEGSELIIEKATSDVCKVMSSDFDVLISEANSEINKAKELIKKKHPIRNRLEVIKLFFKQPKLFIYAYNRRNGN